MAIQDLHFACEDRHDGRFRYYDSIECLLRAAPGAERAWLADYDSKVLHDADSMWVVRANIPSPMGGGFAAFRERSAADGIARDRLGRVGRLADFPIADRDSTGRVP
jgi:nitrous oxide reductase accessory protein NosL